MYCCVQLGAWKVSVVRSSGVSAIQGFLMYWNLGRNGWNFQNNYCPLSGAALLDPFTVPWWNAGCELYIYMRIACKQNCLSTYIDLIGDALRTQTERSPKMCSALQTLCKHSDAAVKSRAQRVWKQLHDSSDDCLQWTASMWNNKAKSILVIWSVSFLNLYACFYPPTIWIRPATCMTAISPCSCHLPVISTVPCQWPCWQSLLIKMCPA